MATLRLENGKTIQIPDGSTPEQAQDFMHQAMAADAPPPQEDTFLGESGIGGIGNWISGAAESQHTFNPSDAWNVLKGMYQGQAKETSGELSSAGEQLRQGNYSDAALHAIGAIPLLGHPLVHSGKNIVEGNYPAAAGDLLALFGPKLAESATRGAGALGESAGTQLYRKALPFTKASSPEDIEGAVREGVSRALPAQSIFAPPGKRTLDKIGSTYKPGTILGDLEGQAKPMVSGPFGQDPVKAPTAFGPFIDKVETYLNANSSSVRAAGVGMLKEAQPGLEKLNPRVASIFADDPATGKPMFSPQQQLQLFKSYVAGDPQDLTVEMAHQGKRDAYDALSSSVYKDSGSATPPPAGGRDANMSLAVGYKNAVNEARPGMVPINEHMHNILTLKDAMNEAAKESPKAFELMTRLAIGAGLGGGASVAAHMGREFTAGAGIAGAIALHAMKDPRVASQIAIVMGNKFPRVAQALAPFAQPVGVAGSAVGQSLRPLGDDEVQQLFQPTPQK